MHALGGQILQMRAAGEHDATRDVCTALLASKEEWFQSLESLQRAVLRHMTNV
jgi:hypothetical protein